MIVIERHKMQLIVRTLRNEMDNSTSSSNYQFNIRILPRKFRSNWKVKKDKTCPCLKITCQYAKKKWRMDGRKEGWMCGWMGGRKERRNRNLSRIHISFTRTHTLSSDYPTPFSWYYPSHPLSKAILPNITSKILYPYRSSEMHELRDLVRSLGRRPSVNGTEMRKTQMQIESRSAPRGWVITLLDASLVVL